MASSIDVTRELRPPYHPDKGAESTSRETLADPRVLHLIQSSGLNMLVMTTFAFFARSADERAELVRTSLIR